MLRSGQAPSATKEGQDGECHCYLNTVSGILILRVADGNRHDDSEPERSLHCHSEPERSGGEESRLARRFMQLTTSPDISNVPTHVAIIMDGNGRWAQKRGLPRLAGHKAGTDNIRPTVKRFAEKGVKYLTIYAFSTENWGRPDPEVKGLLDILKEVVQKETPRLHKDGVKLQHIGNLEGLSQELQRAIHTAVELTKNNLRIILNVAFNYGGRAEIITAIKRLMQDGIKPEELDEALLSNYLYTAGMPDPDLIIRTAGEMRLSNFLIWQAAYSEYYSTPVYWPDFGREEVQKALAAYAQRQRRFGGL